MFDWCKEKFAYPARIRPGLRNVILHEGCTTNLMHDLGMTILTSFLMS